MPKLTPKQQTFYVYALIDPSDDKAFYIGKGSGNRIKHHVIDARKNRQGNWAKHSRILEIERRGLRVIEKHLRWFDLECDAFSLERRLINRLRNNLTNIQSGVITSEESEKIKGAEMLKRLVEFKDWNPGAEIEATVLRVFGDKEQFYNHFKQGLIDACR